MKRIDILSYLLLLFAIVIGVLAILRLKYDPYSQFLVFELIVGFYLLWSVVYHHAKREMTRKLFLEYLIIASIASVVGFVIFR